MLEIFDQFAPLLVDDSHLKIFPYGNGVCPLRVSVPELLPLQTGALGVTLPPTVRGNTSMVKLAHGDKQMPLVVRTK